MPLSAVTVVTQPHKRCAVIRRLFSALPWRRAARGSAATGKVGLGPALSSGSTSPYQVDVIHSYVLEQDAGHTCCVPLHTWVIWEVPGRKKHNLSTISYWWQLLPKLCWVCASLLTGIVGGGWGYP